MAIPFSVECPNCDARLKIQNPKTIGKKVRCPKCQTPFTVKPPHSASPDDDYDADDNYDDYDDHGRAGDDYDDYDDQPPRRSAARPRSGAIRSGRGGKSPGKRSRKKSKTPSWQKPALIGGGVVLGLLLVVGIIFLVSNVAGGGSVELAWLPPDSEMVATVDVDEVWNASLVQRFLKKGDAETAAAGLKAQLDLGSEETIDAIDSITVGASNLPAGGFPGLNRGRGFGGNTNNAADLNVIVVIRKKTAWDMEAIKKKYTEATHEGKTYYTGVLTPASYFPDETTRVMGPEASLKEAMTRGPGNADLQSKFSFLPGGHHVAVAFLPKNAADLTRNVPDVPNLGRKKDYEQRIADSIKEIQGGALGIDLGGGVEIEVTANLKDSGVAGDLAEALQDALADGRQEMNKGREKMEQQLSRMPPEMQVQAREGFHIAESIFNTISAKRSGENVVASVEIPSSVFDKIEAQMKKLPRGGLPGMGVDLGDLFGKLGAMGQAQDAAKRAQGMNNLKQFGLALHNYHDRYQKLPLVNDPRYRNAQGRPQLSWRVHLLPFMEQAPLYNQFRLHEPWDSPHNKALIPMMPATFRSPSSVGQPGKTNYLAVTGPGAIFENGDGCRISDITDGTSNTIMLVEVADHAAVTWTKPEDYEYNSNQPTRNLAGTKGGFHALFADGSVKFLAESINPQTLVHLFQRNDGNRLNDF